MSASKNIIFANASHGFFIQKNSLDIALAPPSTNTYQDDSGIYPGLFENVFVSHPKPMYVFDNHNKALFAFLSCRQAFEKKLSVLHIDAHKDNAKCLFDVPNTITAKNIVEVYKKSRIGDFLDIATKGNLIGKITRITQSFEFDSYILPKKPFILSLDIDIFGPDGECVDKELKNTVITNALNTAAVVTISTSPGFIDQKYAKQLVEKFYKNICQEPV